MAVRNHCHFHLIGAGLPFEPKLATFIVMKKLLIGMLFVLFVGFLVLPSDRSYAQKSSDIYSVDNKFDANNKNVNIVRQELANFCPKDMVEVEGYYCPTVKQKCLRWRNKEGERCEEWSSRVECTSIPIYKDY